MADNLNQVGIDKRYSNKQSYKSLYNGKTQSICRFAQNKRSDWSTCSYKTKKMPTKVSLQLDLNIVPHLGETNLIYIKMFVGVISRSNQLLYFLAKPATISINSQTPLIQKYGTTKNTYKCAFGESNCNFLEIW